MSERKTKATRISNKAHAILSEQSKETGMTITKLIDISVGIEDEPSSNKAISDQESFKQSAIGQALETPWVKDVIAAHAIARSSKPPKAVIDSAILIQFLIDQNYPPVKSRKDLLNSVREKMTEPVNEDSNYTWRLVYPEFFDDYKSSHGRFEKYFDNRIRALINAGILLSVSVTPDYKAMYKLIDLQDHAEQLVIAINRIKPKSGLVLPSIAS